MKALPDLPKNRNGDMTKVLLALSVVVVLLLALPWTAASAADSTSPLVIKNLKIAVWPEYDDPRVLVMYEGAFADGTAFPQAVTFNTIVGGEIKQVCALKQPGNDHECQPFKALEQDGYLAVNYTLPIPTFFLEYYYPGVQSDSNHSFNFKFKSPYQIQTLDIEVQQPLRTSGWTITPTAASISSDNRGFKYNNYTLSNVEAGRVVTIDASYIKTDAKTSVAPATAGGGTSDKTPLVISVVLSLIALGGIGWLLFSGRRRRPSRKPAPALSARAAAKAVRMEQAQAGGRGAAWTPNGRASKSARVDQTPANQRRTVPATSRGNEASVPRAFCSACGSKLDQGRAFCPGCGTEVSANV